MTRKDAAPETHSVSLSSPIQAKPEYPRRFPVWAGRTVGPVLTALPLALIVLTFPRLPTGVGGDSSWSAVLDYAHQNGLQFGPELCFSYGPLGILISPYWSLSCPWLRVFTDLSLAVSVSFGFCLVAWRTGLIWRCFMIGIFGLLAANADPRSELLVFTGFFCWAFLCLTYSGYARVVSAALFTAFAVFGCFAKMSLLFPAALSAVALGCLFLLQGNRRIGFGLPLGFSAAFLIGWMALGQRVSNLGAFVAHGFVMSSAYDETMWAPPFPGMLLPGIFSAVTAAGAIAIRSWSGVAKSEPHQLLQRAVLLTWIAALLFMVWKHGFVCGGRDHLVAFLTLIPLLALVLQILPCPARRVRAYAQGLTLLCCASALFAFNWLYAMKPKAFLGRPFLQAVTHARMLFSPAQYARSMRELQDAEVQASQLPKAATRVAGSKIDVFGWHQAYAVFNHLNYHPRPVFQSYAAYSAPLMNLNEQFYFSPARPDFVLFKLAVYNERLPAMEDAFLFRDLLINYAPVDITDPFLLLQAKANSSAPGLTLIKQGVVRPGEMIGLKEYGNANIWLEINLEPTVLGRITSFLYHPGEITLNAWLESGTIQRASFQTPTPMLAAGFLASPVLLDDRDVLSFYVGKPVVRPSSYSIELGPGWKYLWDANIAFRVFRIENQLGNCAPLSLARLLEFPGFETAPEEVVANKQTFITVAGKPALLLPPDGFMRYVLSGQSGMIQGKYGFAPAAYVLGGATQGAEFRVEQELPDGSLRLLHSRILRPTSNPADRGMKAFSVSCPGSGQRRLLLRCLPLAQNILPSDLTCWAEIGTK